MSHVEDRDAPTLMPSRVAYRMKLPLSSNTTLGWGASEAAWVISVSTASLCKQQTAQLSFAVMRWQTRTPSSTMRLRLDRGR